MVIAFAQPRMGSLEVMKSRSPGQEKCGSLRGMNVQAGVCSAEDSGPGSQDHGEPCGAGDQGSAHSGAQRPSSRDAWFSLELGSRFFLLGTPLSCL